MSNSRWTRRSVLRGAVGATVLGASTAAKAVLIITPNQTEGPFYPRESDRFYDSDNDLVKVESEVKQAFPVRVDFHFR